MVNAEAALERLCNPKFEVSAHYLIAADGKLYQLVDEEKRAWHAGCGAWQGKQDINSRSIGIELDNFGDTPYSESQMVMLEQLLSDIFLRWHILPQNVLGHSDFALGRKQDPGHKFDWHRLALQGLSVWPDCVGDEAVDHQVFVNYASEYGFPRISTNIPEEFKWLLTAFRLRFAPWREGELKSADMTTAKNLATRFGNLRT